MKRILVAGATGYLGSHVTALSEIVNKHQGELLAFFLTATTSAVAAPRFGNTRLQTHFRERVGVSNPIRPRSMAV